MHLVNRNSPAPAVLRTVASVFLLLSAVVYFSAAPAGAAALDQLALAAPARTETPLAPPPSNSTLYSAGPGLNVYFINVGQGDAIYLELPGGKNALIDGGPSTYATSSLASFLKAKNVSAIDHVVLTHPHSDHYNGLQYVFSSLKVGHFYDTRLDNTGAVADDKLRAKAAELKVPTSYPAPGDNLDWSAPGVDIKVLNSCPKAFGSKKSETINNCSIVLKLGYKDSHILFTGDLEGEGEERVLAEYGNALRADVLKVGHHGSKYSSSTPFLNAVRPAKAYIEVGSDNNYGHPTKDALDRLNAIGAKVYRTDLSGTLQESFDGGWEEVSGAAE